MAKNDAIFAEWTNANGRPFRTLVCLRCAIGDDNIEIMLPNSFSVKARVIVAIPVSICMDEPEKAHVAA